MATSTWLNHGVVSPQTCVIQKFACLTPIPHWATSMDEVNIIWKVEAAFQWRVRAKKEGYRGFEPLEFELKFFPTERAWAVHGRCVPLTAPLPDPGYPGSSFQYLPPVQMHLFTGGGGGGGGTTYAANAGVTFAGSGGGSAGDWNYGW